MKPKTYFEKNGVIYGVCRSQLGKVTLYKFHDYEKAERWLNAEMGTFSTRELVSKSVAKQIYRANCLAEWA